MHDFLRSRARLSDFWTRAYKSYEKLTDEHKAEANELLKRYISACWKCDIPLDDTTVYEIVQEVKIVYR